ncbi:hypothetical protein ACO2D6_004304 [Escherichia coli]|uniref:Uncharacterized protein n=1 Tax=Escherichia coli TaxID=562 RepID=A0AAN5KBK8_ECOLX|nr:MULTISPECIES: hypothetical protein [Enterobacteriaceae]EFN8536128.1 hypothetical protein [Escherichia coli O1]MBU4625500.1 hypothetical protein [Shigella sp. GCP5]HDQ6666788.1 hypothetical protein [Escherichia coli O166:H28]EAC1497700.1 hypothetical protein [Escherichia coli]EEC7389636.1 hypothetical protein [Escherichia coli]
MSCYRIKAAGENASALESVMDRVCNIAEKKNDKDVIILIAQKNYGKKDKRLEQILGLTMYRTLMQDSAESVGIGDVSVQLKTFSYITNAAYRANNKTIVVVNPSASDLEIKFKNLHKTTDVIAVEIHSDGELDGWVKDNQAVDL